MRRFLNKKAILALKFLGLFLFVLLIVYLLVNGPALYQKLKYKTKSSDLSQTDNFTLSEEYIKGGRLIIPKINVNAPVIFLESTEEEDMMESLENGVVRWPDTALPGEEGNCVITGHSSSPWWHKGEYKTIFALLNELETDDLVIIYYDQQRFTYRVVGKDIVLSNNIEILSQNKKETPMGFVEPTLTLFTCWPLGTDLRRLVVKAELVD